METTIETQQQKDINTILSNPYLSAPVLFNLQQHPSGGLLISSNFFDSRDKSERSIDEERLVSGSIVANPSVVGSSAQVIATTGRCHGVVSQRLLVKTSSPNAPEQHKTLDFFPIFNSNYHTVPAGGNLGLRVTDGFLAPTEDSAKVNLGNTLPLIVGPESAVIGKLDPSTISDMDSQNIAFGSIWNIAKKVLPVVAKSGYEIYQELAKEESQQLVDSDLDGIFDVFKSVTKIAVPIAGSILSAL